MVKTFREISDDSNNAIRQSENLRRRYDSKIAKNIRDITGENVNYRKVQKYLKEHEELLKEESIARLQATRKGSTAKQYRKNEQFKQNFRKSARDAELTNITKVDKDAFYAATAHMWRHGTNILNRNDDILSAMGISDLEQAFKLISSEELKAEDFGFDDKVIFEDFIENLNQTIKLDKIREIVKEEKRIRDNNKKKGGNTNEEQYNGPEVQHKDGSPEFSKNIITRVAELFADD